MTEAVVEQTPSNRLQHTKNNVFISVSPRERGAQHKRLMTQTSPPLPERPLCISTFLHSLKQAVYHCSPSECQLLWEPSFHLSFPDSSSHLTLAFIAFFFCFPILSWFKSWLWFVRLALGKYHRVCLCRYFKKQQQQQSVSFNNCFGRWCCRHMTRLFGSSTLLSNPWRVHKWILKSLDRGPSSDRPSRPRADVCLKSSTQIWVFD